ncbi:hypothetical protein J4G08_01320 [Candidatus Poribacteria bacterium]|nr:hypothetical protein [Candidatus Poribacteria bacterium]
MKSSIIYLIVILTVVIVGCGPSTRSYWEPTVWHVQENKSNVPEIGTLQDNQFNYNVIVTDFGKVVRGYDIIDGTPYVTQKPKKLIAVVVRCQNTSNGTLLLDSDPIQLIDASQTLAKKLTHQEVIFRLYGGRMRQSSQLRRLRELKRPMPEMSTFLGAVLAGYVEALRADERAMIINEIYQKEYAGYDILHQRFEPSSLPSGVSTNWVQYYQYSPGPIRIVLQGQNVSDGLLFALPPPKPPPAKPAPVEVEKHEFSPGIFIAFVGIIVGAVIIGSSLID